MQSQQPIGRAAKGLSGYGQLTIFLIPIGIATNFVGGQIATLLKLPMYLDCIGTILVGALCGGLPGALVGLVSNLLNSITSPTLLPFALINILVGLLAGWLSRLGVFRSLAKTLVSSLGFSLIGAGLGGLITIIVFGGLGGNGVAIITGALRALGFGLVPAVYISSFPADVLDKLVTVLIVFFVLARVPTRLLVKVPLGAVYLGRRRRHVIEIPDDDLALEV